MKPNTQIKILTDAVNITDGVKNSFLNVTKDTGRIIYRNKIDTLIGVKHPGIILGNDIWGDTWVVHNHYKDGIPTIVKIGEFSLGLKVVYDKRKVFYDPIAIAVRAIKAWSRKEPYKWLTNNCQHFVNKVAQNKKYSDTVEEVSDKVIIGGGLVCLLGLVMGNGNLIKAGIGIAGIGVAGKVISKS